VHVCVFVHMWLSMLRVKRKIGFGVFFLIE
jgi:hypothetical protein